MQGLEKRFDVQKYVTKPDRRQLAAMLGLTDAQVKTVIGMFKNKILKISELGNQLFFTIMNCNNPVLRFCYRHIHN